jgi:2-methylcitrate dehydratase PrpD
MKVNSVELEGLAKFAVDLKYEDLTPAIVKDVKIFLMDSIGCGLTGVTTDPGKMFISLAKRLGGPPESSIIGVSGKVSCVNAAMANGQLINAIDYDSISGHTPPYIVPPALAMAESLGASGKQFILSMALGLEISTRIGRALLGGSFMGGPGAKFRWANRSGYASYNFAVAASVGKLLKLDLQQTLNAMGTAGHLTQVLTWIRYTFQGHRAMTKYGVPGWQITGGVMAALLAQEGFIGDTTIFDPEEGFWKLAGYESWNGENILQNLGKDWTFFHKIMYKPYPSCRMFQTELDCFLKILDDNKINAQEIEHVSILGHPTLEAPAFTNRELNSIVDIQFNPAYTFAMAANKVPRGVDWQDLEIARKPEIQKLFKNIEYHTYPEFMTTLMSKVEVKARGKVYKEEKKFTELNDLTEDELFAKFRHNALRILTQDKVENAIDTMMKLEKISDVNRLTALITL